MINKIVSASAVVALVAGIGGGVWALDARFALKKEVASNAQQILLIRIENARAGNQKETLRRLCDDYRQIFGWTPSACKRGQG